MDQDRRKVQKPMHGGVVNSRNSNKTACLQRGHPQAGLWTILGVVNSHMVHLDRPFAGETTLEY